MEIPSLLFCLFFIAKIFVVPSKHLDSSVQACPLAAVTQKPQLQTGSILPHGSRSSHSPGHDEWRAVGSGQCVGRRSESALARKIATQDGHERLEEAMAILIQNQAAFVGSLRETDRRLAEYERVTSERFGRIEADIATILRVLSEQSRILEVHTRMLERLPEALRDKIGFRTQQ